MPCHITSSENCQGNLYPDDPKNATEHFPGKSGTDKARTSNRSPSTARWAKQFNIKHHLFLSVFLSLSLFVSLCPLFVHVKFTRADRSSSHPKLLKFADILIHLGETDIHQYIHFSVYLSYWYDTIAVCTGTVGKYWYLIN